MLHQPHTHRIRATIFSTSYTLQTLKLWSLTYLSHTSSTAHFHLLSFSSFRAHRSHHSAAPTYTTPSSSPGVIGSYRLFFLFPFASPGLLSYGYSKRHGNEFDITASSQPLWLEVRKSLKGWAFYCSIFEGVGGRKRVGHRSNVELG